MAYQIRRSLQVSMTSLLAFIVLPVALADQPAKESRFMPPRREVRIPDVSLREDGAFFGKVVDAQGCPIAKAEILFCQTSKTIAKVLSHEQGDFYVTGLRPGVYQVVVSPNHTVTVRVWDKHSAPPIARSELLIIVGHETVRGQRRLGELLPLENTVVVGGMVAAAIAIPIAVANSSDDTEPVSP